MKYWFTADYHLGHKNIIEYCNRPFKSLEDMQDTIIRNHNMRVKDEDIVFHVGDFCFKNSAGGKDGEGIAVKAREWEEKLNGNIIHIRGNHDKNNSVKTIVQSLQVKYGGRRINLVHNPIHVNFDFKLNFVGHVHSDWTFKRWERRLNKKRVIYTDMINIGIDAWNYMPVTYEEIIKIYNRWKICRRRE